MRKKIIATLLVLSFVITGVSVCGTKTLAASKISATKITSLKACDFGFTVKFDKVANASGYQIRYALDYEMTDAITKSTTKTSFKTTELEGGTEYFVKVRAYKKLKSGKKSYSSWSNTRKVVTLPTKIIDYQAPDILMGGWGINRNITECKMPEGAKDVFSKAMSDMVGVSYTPVAYIGRQVVAGTNHMYLCVAKLVTAKPEFSLKYVTIYEDLKGKCEVLEIEDYSFADYMENREADAPAPGGFVAYDGLVEGKFETGVKEAYDRAMKDYVGTTIIPVSLLGSQVVAGCNYQFLCVTKPTTPDASSHIVIVTIYDVPWKNESTLTAVYNLF